MNKETFLIPAKERTTDTPVSVYYISMKSGFINPFWLVKRRRKFWFDKTMAKFEYESYERGKQLAIDTATTLERGSNMLEII